MTEFNEALFKTKVDNIFIKIHNAIMEGNLKDVKHFMNEEVFTELNNYINDLALKKQRQIYDEVNVKNSFIKERKVLAEKEVVTVGIFAKYMDYIIDINSGKIISGTDKKRIEKSYTLVFEKNINTKTLGLNRKCPNCGASMDINNSGKCSFCGSTFDLYNYDYILTSLTKY